MLGWTSSTRRLVASPQAEEILQLNRLNDLDAVFRVGAAARSRHNGRGVCPVELQDVSGSKFTTYFKLNWGRARLWPRMTDIKTRQVFQSLVLREWLGIERLEREGFKVPERIALWEDGLIERRAAVIIRSVPPKSSISEMVRSTEWTSRPEDERESVIEAALGTIAHIYSRGLAWRGSSTRHMYPVRDARGAWTMWLIDCEGVHDRSSSTLARDVDKFLRSLQTDHRKREEKSRRISSPAEATQAAA